MNNLQIGQNPDRYSKIGGQWKISASNDINPIYLPIGVPLSNLKPVIQTDGIVVKVEEDYLCSPTTLSIIQDTNNPHFDAVQNGTIKIKDKEVIIGNTIKIIELDISRLRDIGNLQDTKGIKAGVSSVEYIYEGEDTDGVSNNLISQINYTLNEDSVRGLDTYTLYQLKLAPDDAYSIDALQTVTQPQNELLDMKKLKAFTEGVRERMVLLRKDFNMIKRMFFDGIIPDYLGKVEITSTGLSDPSKLLLGQKDYHQVIYKEVGEYQTIRDTQAVQRNLQKDVTTQQDILKKQEASIQQQIATTAAGTQNAQFLQEQLAATRQQLADIQKTLSSPK